MFADRINEIQPFRVMEVLARAAELEAEGHRVVHLQVGEPDFATAAPVLAAAQQALRDGHTKYTAATGIPALRAAIASYYRDLDISVDPERIIVTSGASGGLTLLSALLLNPRDELLITDPGYPCNEVFAHLVGAVPRAVAVGANQRFQPQAQDLLDAWTDRTRGALLASPANPTGTMLPAAQLREICAALAQRQGFLILDEIYQGLHAWPEGERGASPEYRSGLQINDSLYVLNSFSKYFGMTGWRLGWLVVPAAAVDAVTRLAQNLFISPSTPAQYAALAAFTDEAMQIHESRAQAFRQRARLLMDGLRAMGFRIPVEPDGAFYAYVDVSHTGMHSRDFCWRLLDEFQVAVTPGEDFGEQNSERYVRF
ncbi:MAG: aminotransferase class I/II-fold pyridoxal phosphate-dependent enzyme, partial [Pseudomonadota bacterium]